MQLYKLHVKMNGEIKLYNIASCWDQKIHTANEAWQPYAEEEQINERK